MSQYLWQPKADITLEELTQCLPVLINGQGWWVRYLPEAARRHFLPLPSDDRAYLLLNGNIYGDHPNQP